MAVVLCLLPVFGLAEVTDLGTLSGADVPESSYMLEGDAFITLNNATLTAPLKFETSSADAFTVTIRLKGSNSIDYTGGDFDSAIEVSSNMKLKIESAEPGSSLLVEAHGELVNAVSADNNSVTIAADDVTLTSDWVGIHYSGLCEISGSNVCVTTQKASVQDHNLGDNTLIISGDNVELKSTGSGVHGNGKKL